MHMRTHAIPHMHKRAPSHLITIAQLYTCRYWGKGTVDSAKYFCKPAIDLDVALATLGSERLVEIGLGDDQHENGYDAAFSPWMDGVFDALGVPSIEGEDVGGPHTLGADDDIKTDSNYLRGNILQSLADTSTGKILPEDTKLTKFHGIYQQDDRDIRQGLEDAGKERAYSFMIRVGLPGGVCTPEQYLRMSNLAVSHASGNLKLTTRQAFQLHGVIKNRLKPTIQEINKGLMDTLAACGDVCRNVIATPLPLQTGVHAEVLAFAQKLSTHLKPQTSACVKSPRRGTLMHRLLRRSVSPTLFYWSGLLFFVFRISCCMLYLMAYIW
jgi:sulfite reductase (NADPH) hemoprotein beta-component